MPMESRVCVYQVHSGAGTGSYNMALDEALLAWVRLNAEIPTVVVRTYQWCLPTLSVGVHQGDRDICTILRKYHSDLGQGVDLVRRPTGGRAILHDTDVSFSFITNVSQILKGSLADSYRIFTALLKTALGRIQSPVFEAATLGEAPDDKAYTRSPLCFQTHTPYDLLDEKGQKLAGCAQLRREGGVLVHGTIFLETADSLSNPLMPERFSQALFEEVARFYGKAVLPDFPLETDPVFETDLYRRIRDYCRESAGIFDRAIITTESHLVPASC